MFSIKVWKHVLRNYYEHPLAVSDLKTSFSSQSLCTSSLSRVISLNLITYKCHLFTNISPNYTKVFRDFQICLINNLFNISTWTSERNLQLSTSSTKIMSHPDMPLTQPPAMRQWQLHSLKNLRPKNYTYHWLHIYIHILWITFGQGFLITFFDLRFYHPRTDQCHIMPGKTISFLQTNFLLLWSIVYTIASVKIAVYITSLHYT